jgi:hypothetical protein
MVVNSYRAHAFTLWGIPTGVWEVYVNNVRCCRVILEHGELRITRRFTMMRLDMEAIRDACHRRSESNLVRCA